MGRSHTVGWTCGRAQEPVAVGPSYKFPRPSPLQSLHGKEWLKEDLEGQPRPLPGQPLGLPEVRRLVFCVLHDLSHTCSAEWTTLFSA